MNPKDQTKPSRVEVEAEEAVSKMYGFSPDFNIESLKKVCKSMFVRGHSLAQDDLKAALEILNSLTNEADGFHSMADYYDHGITNMNCMRNRIDEAKEFLSRMRAGNESAGEGK